MPKLRPIAGIAFLCQDPDGNIIGDKYVSDQSSLRERQYIHKLNGEKWGVTLTEVERLYMYPEIKGFVPEGLIALEMAKDFDDITINEPLRIYYPSEDGLTRRKRWPPTEGEILYAWAMIRRDWTFAWRQPWRFLKVGLVVLASPLLLILARRRAS